MARTKDLRQLIDDAMRETGMDSKSIERDYGVPSSWTRNLKAGRIKDAPDPARIAIVAQALRIPEIEIWRRLGRFDRVADLRGELPPGVEESLSPEVILAIQYAVREAVETTVEALRQAGWAPPGHPGAPGEPRDG